MIIIWIWLKLNIVKEESILSIRDVGIQVKTIYMNGRSVSKFIDKSKISDIIINEGITMLQVKFYMAIIVDGQDRMVVVFEVNLIFLEGFSLIFIFNKILIN